MEHFFRIIELLAVIASGVYGILLGRRQGMDFVGIFALAAIVAFGGGTLRDLFLDRHPLFWIRHSEYTVILFGLALITSFVRRLPVRLEKFLSIPDAFGLGLFSILGAGYALEAGTSWFVAALLGVVTGAFGGVVAEVICNEVPSLFKSAPLYATCSFVGCWTFLLLQWTTLSQEMTVLCGITVIVVTRLIAVRWNLRLPCHSET